ncbi:MAG: hypothetical protein ABI887_10635, partial [Burkholderiales bacterium]
DSAHHTVARGSLSRAPMVTTPVRVVVQHRSCYRYWKSRPVSSSVTGLTIERRGDALLLEISGARVGGRMVA